MNKRLVYLDNNATTPLHPEVKETIWEILDVYGNPSSLHQFGRKAKKMVEDAREKVANFIGADHEDVFFVGSGSEASNTVLAIFQCSPLQCGRQCAARHEIVTSTIEHPCILETANCLKHQGADVKLVKVDRYGKIDMDDLKVKLTDKTGLLSVMMANNEIGTIQDVKTLARMAHLKGAMFHTDAVQALGKIPIDVKELDVDFLTMSAHKIYGPKGVGAVYVRKGAKFCPFIVGGHQEKGRRAGTENTLGIIAMGKAVELRQKEIAEDQKRLLELKQMLKAGIEKNIEQISFNGHPTESLSNTLNISFEGVEGEAVQLYLDMEGIAVSTGSACASGSLDPSHVILATGTPAEQAHGSIRLSLGRETTKEDIEYTIIKITEVIKKVREISTAY